MGERKSGGWHPHFSGRSCNWLKSISLKVSIAIFFCHKSLIIHYIFRKKKGLWGSVEDWKRKWRFASVFALWCILAIKNTGCNFTHLACCFKLKFHLYFTTTHFTHKKLDFFISPFHFFSYFLKMFSYIMLSWCVLQYLKDI